MIKKSQNKNLHQLLVPILIGWMFLLSSCGFFKVELGLLEEDATIVGVVYPISKSFQNKSKPVAAKANEVKTFSCSSPQASLYRIGADGKVIQPALGSVPVDENGQYKFTNLADLDIDTAKMTGKTKFFVEVQGCSEPLARLITGLTEQNVHYGSSLISWMPQSEASHSISTSSPEKVQALMSLLRDADSQTDAFSLIQANSNLSAIFREAFGVEPKVLADAAPKVLSTSVPQTADELANLALMAAADHWSGNYPMIYEWKLDSLPLSKGNNISWRPSANSQGMHTLKLFVGQDDGTGHVDTNKPYTARTFPIVIANSSLPTPPTFSIVGPSDVNAPEITLQINTGPLNDGIPNNCASFSKLALVESDDKDPLLVSPLSESSYTITCTSANTQTLALTLQTGEGAKTLRLWARDAAGNVSASPTTLAVRYSTIGPKITIASPAEQTPTNKNILLAGTCEADIENITIYGDIKNSPVTATCAASEGATLGSYSHSIELVGADGAKSVTVLQTNSFGNIGNASRSFVLDTTPPTVSLSSTAANPTRFSPIAVEVSFSENVTDLAAEDFTVTNGSVTSLTGSGSSYVAQITPAANGVVSVSVKANAGIDVANNPSLASSSSLTRTFDTQAPSVNIARATGQKAITNQLPIEFDLIFSEPLKENSLTAAEISLNGSAATGANLNITTEDQKNFKVRITSTTVTQGGLVVALPAGVAEDLAGNLNSATASSASVAYDAVLPTFPTLTVTPAGPSNIKRPVLSGTTEGSSLVSFHVGADCSAPALASGTADSSGNFSLTPTSDIAAVDGSYELRIKAIDLAENVACSTAKTYVLDTGKPTVTIARAADQSALVRTLPIKFDITFSENMDAATVDLNKISKSGSATGITWSLNQIDAKKFQLEAAAVSGAGDLVISMSADQVKDISGNFNLASAGSASVTYDNVLPTFSGLAVSPVSPATNPRPTVSGSTESLSSVTLHLDATCSTAAIATGTAAADGAFSLTPAADIGVDGNYSFKVKATDPAGNSDCSTAVLYTLDRLPRSVTINSTGLGPSPSNSLAARTVTVSGSDVVAYKATVITSGLCSAADFSAAVEIPIANSFSFTPTANQSHTVCAIGKSMAGVWADSATAASSSVLAIDTVAPVFSGLAIAPGALANERRPTLSGTTELSSTVHVYTTNNCTGTSLGNAVASSGGAFSVQLTSNLSTDAAYAFYLKATDTAGNNTCSSTSVAYTLDTTAPVLAFSAPAASSYVNALGVASVAISGTCSENASVTLGASDGSQSVSGTATCSSGTFTSNLNLSTLAEGNVTLSLSGTDSSGNLSTTVTRMVIKDTIAPTTTLSGTPSSPSNATALNVTVAGTGVTHYKSKVGTAASIDCTNTSGYGAETAIATAITSSVSGLADGSLKLCVIGRDLAGNWAAVGTAHTWTKDTALPTLSFTTPAASALIGSSGVSALSITGSCSENTRTVTVKAITGGTTVTGSPVCTSGSFSTTLNISSLAEGTVNLTADMSDVAGNNAAQATRSITKDTVAPVVTLAGNPTSSSKVTTLSMTAAGTDVTHYKYMFGSASIDCTVSASYSAERTVATSITDSISALPDGSVKVCAIGRDLAGNWQSTASSTSVTWTKDTVVTAFSGLAIAPGAVGNNAKPTISGSTEISAIVDLYKGLACTGTVIANGTAHATTGAFSLTPAADIGTDGDYTFSVKATDLAGNTLCSSNIVYKLDRVGPTATFASTAPSPTKTSPIPFTLTFSEAVTGLILSDITVTGGTAGSLTGSGTSYSFSVTPSAQGTVSVALSANMAQDAAGNGNTAATTISRVYDSVAPALAITSPGATSYSQGTITFSGTCETGLSVVFSGAGYLSGGPATCSAGNFTTTITLTAGAGDKVITASQTDAALNTSSVSRTVTRDNTAPVITQTTLASPVSTKANTVTFGGACETGLPITVKRDGVNESTTVTCTSSAWSYAVASQTTDGSRVYTFHQTDTAGNTANATATWVRDNVAPNLTFTSTAIQNQTTNTNTVTFTGACETGISVVVAGGIDASSTSCTSSAWTYTTVSRTTDATRAYSFTQTDAAGNVKTINGSWVRDATAPNLTITSPAAGTTAQASLTITGACETGRSVDFTGTGLLSNVSATCTSSAFSQTVFFSSGDGTKTITLTQTDVLGNTATVSRDFVRDNVAPAITQTTLSFPYYSNTNTVTFGGSCENGSTVAVLKESTSMGTVNCTSGAWSYAAPTQSTDATINFTFSQTDAAGNTGTTTGRWIRDTVVPALAFTSASSSVTASNYVTFAGTCEAGLPYNVEISGADTATTACSSGTWTYNTATRTTDAVRTYTFKLRDQAGNIKQITGTWERNTQVPNLLITTASPVINQGNSATFAGNCETGLSIEVKRDGTLETNITCPAGVFSYTTTAQTTDASRVYTFKQTNALSLSTTASTTWVRDTTAPVLTSAKMILANGAAVTSSARVLVDLAATDSLTKITHFCLKTDDVTNPASNDNCWTPVDSPAVGLTPALSLNLNDFGYNLPLTPKVYSVYSWVRDQAGNASVLSNAGAGTAGKDVDSIEYIMPVPPQVELVLVGSNDYPAQPPSTNDLTVGSGAPLYIKWRITDDKALPATAVSLYFTTDDNTYTAIGTGLPNGASGGCTVNHASTPADNTATGCYKWASIPTGNFLRIRVIATDSEGLTSGGVSTSLNIASTLRFLAGNTDPGLNLSASSAMFFSRRMYEMSTTDTQSLVVTRDGVVFFKDVNRGILKVDPADGVQRLFLDQTGTSSGDNGPVANATATNILKIALDHNQPKQRLWIFDYNRIRRVNLETGVITTVIGGGADNNDTVANPLNAQVTAMTNDPDGWHGWIPFFALPNGDFYFQAGNDGYQGNGLTTTYRIRYLEAATGQIKTYRLSSLTSTSRHTSGDFSLCQHRGFGVTYDPQSGNIDNRIAHIRVHNLWTHGCNTYGDSVAFLALDQNGATIANQHPTNIENWNDTHRLIQGLNGELYSVAKSRSVGIRRYNKTTRNWDTIVGNGNQGSCSDGTLATQCPGYFYDAFVNENGTLFFVDDGRIRTLTNEGTVVTLMGQPIIGPEGAPSLTARLGNYIGFFGARNDGGITFTDRAHNKFWEVDPNGSLFHIAGNGIAGGVGLGVDARTTSLNLEWPYNSGDDFGLDPATGDIYHHGGDYYIRKLTRSTASIGSIGTWSHFSGGGTYGYAHASADNSSSISFTADYTIGHDSTNWHSATYWFGPQVSGFGGGKILVGLGQGALRSSDNARIYRNPMLKLYDKTTGVQSHLIGTITGGTGADNTCATGTPLNECTFIHPSHFRTVAPTYDAIEDRWLAARYTWGSIYSLKPGGTMATLTTVSHGIRAFTYRKKGTEEFVYYCSHTTGRLRRKNVTTNTEVELNWPVTSMTCREATMTWDDTKKGVTFIYEQNGLYGFAMYFDP